MFTMMNRLYLKQIQIKNHRETETKCRKSNTEIPHAQDFIFKKA